MTCIHSFLGDEGVRPETGAREYTVSSEEVLNMMRTPTAWWLNAPSFLVFHMNTVCYHLCVMVARNKGDSYHIWGWKGVWAFGCHLLSVCCKLDFLPRKQLDSKRLRDFPDIIQGELAGRSSHTGHPSPESTNILKNQPIRGVENMKAFKLSQIQKKKKHGGNPC